MWHAADSDSIHLSLYVIADLDSESGLTFVKEALHSIVSILNHSLQLYSRWL
jgi:hypothetical protein